MSGRQYVDRDEWLTLHQVAIHARDAVEIAADAGIHLGPLRAALDKTPYRVEGNRGWRTGDQEAPRTRTVIVTGGKPGMTTADVYEVDAPDG